MDELELLEGLLMPTAEFKYFGFLIVTVEGEGLRAIGEDALYFFIDSVVVLHGFAKFALTLIIISQEFVQFGTKQVNFSKPEPSVPPECLNYGQDSVG